MVRIDRRTGSRVFDGWPSDEPTASIIWEAFKPDTEPRRTQRQDEIDAMRELILAQLRRRERGPVQSGEDSGGSGTGEDEPVDFAEDQGGIY